MLGDGRAVLLGEQSGYDVQLKGSGRTKYSRGGDGRAALAPMLREYIISEAMHGLGIPTTRSLAVVATGEVVEREKKLPGAVLTRIASSHIRVGTFEYAANFGKEDDVRSLADYTITRHFPDITDDNKYLALLKEVIKRQALLISKWQLVGFIHGVMNTDNMAISGETIDYGPCAFTDSYHPDTVFSSIDVHGRYAYKNQPKIAPWNLARFAETLLPLLPIKLAQDEISNFQTLYKQHWLAGMRAKLGLITEEPDDTQLIEDLLQQIQQSEADYTNTFRSLSLKMESEFPDWNKKWHSRLSRQQHSHDQIQSHMKKHNPSIIPRNHIVEDVLASAEKGDLNPMYQFLNALRNPFDYTNDHEEYTKEPSSSCDYKTFCGT